MDDKMIDYRKIIIDRRKELNISQRKLSKLAGISQSNMNSIECGRRNPSVEALIRICEVLDIDFMTIPEKK